MKDRISNDLFFKNLVASGTISSLGDVEKILPMKPNKPSRFWTYFEMTALLLAFAMLIAIGFSYGLTRWSN